MTQPTQLSLGERRTEQAGTDRLMDYFLAKRIVGHSEHKRQF
jgi:hypothetical protein